MRLIRLLSIASRRQIMLPALKVALVVGTLLNLVNQGGNLLSGGPINLTQMLLNFVVPFCVSSYSAARNEMRRCEE
ncbi:MAG: nitrate/nitrite transporter NrtS [Sideroxydans sp.]|nr:nitrate/nitrite transporter NrtS [Sideroxydans sp.]